MSKSENIKQNKFPVKNDVYTFYDKTSIDFIKKRQTNIDYITLQTKLNKNQKLKS